MAELASSFGIKHAVVRKREEAQQIVSLFETVLVLGDSIKKDDSIRYVINDLDDIAKAEKGAKVELKVDTGMHRNGIALSTLDEALALIKEKGLLLLGVMTHYRSADVLSSELFWQEKQFETVKNRVKDAGFENIRFHSYNSAAILRLKHFEEDLVRVGISAYGYNELENSFDEVTLHPVLSLHAQKVSTRVLKEGECIGYGGDFTADKEMFVSTYDLGYGDGWARGNVQNPYITSESLPLLGRVSMDFIILASEKEEICIMHNAQQAAAHYETISYEITTALSANIPKIVI